MQMSNRVVVDLSPTSLNIGTTNETFQQSGKQDSFRHITKSWLVCMKLQGHCSLEPLLEYNQDQTLLINQGLL